MFEKRIGFDYETALFQPGLAAPPPVCLALYTHEKEELLHAHLHADQTRDRVADLLFGDQTFAIANAAFDMAVTANRWPELLPMIFDKYDANEVYCLRIAEQMLDNSIGELGEHTGYSLSKIEKKRLGVDRAELKHGPDIWRTKYWTLRDVPLEEWEEAARAYAMGDAKNHLLVADDQLRDAHLLKNLPAQCAAAFALKLIQCRGLRTSEKGIREFEKIQVEWIGDHLPLFEKLGFYRADGTRNTAVIKEYIAEAYRSQSLDVPLTETGLVGTSRVVCEDSGDENLFNYSELSRRKNILKNDIPKLEKGIHAPIQAEFEPFVSSGRTACRLGNGALNGFQLQNPKREKGVRECFVARPGYVFADADYTGLELCTVAQVCFEVLGFSSLGDALNAGIDPHLALGAQILREDYAKVFANRKIQRVKDARQFAKVGNFGFPGGLGIRGLIKYAREGYGMHLDPARAAGLKNDFLSRWVEFGPYFEWIRSQLVDYGDGEMFVPRLEQLYVQRFRGKVSFTAACNSMFQGLGSDVVKPALWEVTKACNSKQSPLYGSFVVNTVHDQIIAEVPESCASDAAKELGRIMVTTANERFLTRVPVKCEPCLSYTWSKDAVAVYDAKKNLIAWDSAREGRVTCYDAEGKVFEWI